MALVISGHLSSFCTVEWDGERARCKSCSNDSFNYLVVYELSICHVIQHDSGVL